MKAEVEIQSYFSLDTDLAGEMKTWPEFRSGSGYNVELESGAERVSVAFVEREDQKRCYVQVLGSQAGPLFDRVLGRACYALAAHSDALMIKRRS